MIQRPIIKRFNKLDVPNDLVLIWSSSFWHEKGYGKVLVKARVPINF